MDCHLLTLLIQFAHLGTDPASSLALSFSSKQAKGRLLVAYALRLSKVLTCEE